MSTEAKTQPEVQPTNEKEIEVICRRGRLINLGNYENEYIEYAESAAAYPSTRKTAYAELEKSVKERLDAEEKQIREEHAKKQATTQQTTPLPATTPEAPTSTGDQYAQLPWNQSKNDTRLGTIRVTEKLTQNNPLALQLYNQLKAAEKQALSINGITYRLSVTTRDSQFVPAGTEYLQRWGR